MRVTARAVETAVFPNGARIPVTSLQLAGDRIAFWTIMPLQPGDHVELMARTRRRQHAARRPRGGPGA